MSKMKFDLSASALRLLDALAHGAQRISKSNDDDARTLIDRDLAIASSPEGLVISETGQRFLTRRKYERDNPDNPSIDAFRAQHLSIVDAGPCKRTSGVKFDESESPLVWLARRKGVDGRPLIEPHQLQAGERLRSEFTVAQMMPRTTANWHSPVSGRRSGGISQSNQTERMVTARQNVRHALDIVGPEFAGLLVDVCCFLKKLDDVERERRWPARSAKVVLQLALERLARHYGYRRDISGKGAIAIRTWEMDDGGRDAAQAAAASRASD